MIRVAIIPVFGPVEYLDVPKMGPMRIAQKVGGRCVDVGPWLDGRHGPASMFARQYPRSAALEVNVRAVSLLAAPMPVRGTVVLTGPVGPSGHATSLPDEWEDVLRKIEDTVYGERS